MRPEVLDYEILMKARALIEDPTKWIKGSLYAKISGKNCRIQNAERYCALGALTVALRQMGNLSASSRTATTTKAGKLLAEAIPVSRGPRIEPYNDSPWTSHQDVLDLFDRAAAKAKQLATAPLKG